jgi:Rod binding domain-containing protein
MAEIPAAVAAAKLAAQTPAGVDPARARNRKEIERAAEEFEALFLSQMLEHMFEGIRADGPFGGGHAEEMYRSFMLQEYGKSIAKGGGVGIADMVKREMLRAQEGASAPAFKAQGASAPAPVKEGE